jgi:hypothetical protein
MRSYAWLLDKRRRNVPEPLSRTKILPVEAEELLNLPEREGSRNDGKDL